jgi:glutathionyl-hydroquinone reductase
MGLLIDGVWVSDEEERSDGHGHFWHPGAAFRNWVTSDGRPGPTGHDGYAAAKGRYHLYVSLACPWAHRTLIGRALKGLEDIIPISVTHWLVADQGWTFSPGEGVIPDMLFNSRYLHEIYTRADSQYSGRATVPVLWDRHTQTIVSNESSEILRMMNTAFDAVGANSLDLYPSGLRQEIDALSRRIYEAIDNGVYHAGFATTQSTYDEAASALFETLDWLDKRLATNRFICGDTITEADIGLFATLIRFDMVFFFLFKCSKKRLRDYQNVWDYTREIFQWPDVASTINLTHIRRHYYQSYTSINPNGKVSTGPIVDFNEPVDRTGGVARLLTF